MNRKMKQTGIKSFLMLMGISLSLVFLFSGTEAAAVDYDLYQPLSFNSIVNPHSLINIDGIAFMCGTSSNSTTDKKTDTNTSTSTTTTPTTTTDKNTTAAKSGKKTITDQKNSTSQRRAIIID